MEAKRPLVWTSVRIGSVKIADRHRKDMGDLQSLADSIREVGLLQPIGVTKNNGLVYGHRRLLAARDLLGWKEITAVIVDLDSIVSGEYAENEIRKDFTLSERDSIRRAIDAEEKAKAKERQKRKPESVQQNSAEQKPKQPDRTKQPQSRTAAAKRVGLGSHDTASKVAKVVDKGSPELVKAMDKGAVSVNAAAKLADLPVPKQAEVAAAATRGEKKTVNQAVKEAEQQAKPEWMRGPSPKEIAKNSPGRKWTKLMHDMWMSINSVRDCGGIKQLTSEWADDEKEAYVDELRKIIERFEGWITELEVQ